MLNYLLWLVIYWYPLRYTVIHYLIGKVSGMEKMSQENSVVAALLASVRTSWKVTIHYINGALLILFHKPLYVDRNLASIKNYFFLPMFIRSWKGCKDELCTWLVTCNILMMKTFTSKPCIPLSTYIIIVRFQIPKHNCNNHFKNTKLYYRLFKTGQFVDSCSLYSALCPHSFVH